MQKQLSFLVLILVVLGAIAFFIHDQENAKRTSLNDASYLIASERSNYANAVPLRIELVGANGVLLRADLNSGTLGKGALGKGALDNSAMDEKFILNEGRKVSEITSTHLMEPSLVSEESLESFQYPVEKTFVAALIRSVMQAKIIETKSARVEHQVNLGLVEPTDSEGSGLPESGVGTLLNLHFADAVEPISLVIGNAPERINGQFVRFTNSSQMYLVDQQFSLPDSEFEWLSQSLLDLNADNIVNVQREGRNSWQINVNNGVTSLANMQNDTALKYPNVLSNYLDTLSALKFEAVTPYAEAKWGAYELALILKVNTQSGEEHTVLLAAEEVKPEQTANKDMENDDVQNAEEKHYYLSFNAKGQYAYLNNWMYKIPSFQAEALLMQQTDFMAPSK